jgi:hypothetical protein
VRDNVPIEAWATVDSASLLHPDIALIAAISAGLKASSVVPVVIPRTWARRSDDACGDGNHG